MWITIQETCEIFGKGRSTVDFAIWRDSIKARRAVVGKGWLVEYESCVKFWGAPVALHLVDMIKAEINV